MMKLRSAISLLLVALAWIPASGCENKGGNDNLRAVPVDKGLPSRIVSLAPSVTEVLFALGLDEQIVGVTEYCDYPEAARTKPRVGGLKDPSLESILTLSPELVISTKDGNDNRFMASLERMGIRVVKTQPSTIAEVMDSVLEIGEVVGRPVEAREVVADMERRLSEVRSRVEGAPRVRALMVYGRRPLVLAGPGTFADDMIVLAGGENIAGDAPMPYPRFSMETVVARSPEVIIEGAMGSEDVGEKAAEAVKFWSRWGSISAVRDGRVVVINQDLIARPGPRILDGLEAIARALHPDRFGGGEDGG